jgi:hypothetical protein
MSVVLHNSVEVSDIVFEWLKSQPTRPTLTEIEEEIRRLTVSQPVFVANNAKRRVLNAINNYGGRFPWE